MYKYYHAYSKQQPELIEGDIFKMIIHTELITPQATPQATPQDTPQATEQAAEQAAGLDERTIRILKFCKTPKSREEIQKFIGIKDREYFRKNILKALINSNLLKLTIPDKPSSPKQKYYSVINLKE